MQTSAYHSVVLLQSDREQFTSKVVDLICKPALNILKCGMNKECTILMTCMNSQSCKL